MAEERTVFVRIKAVFDEFAKGFKDGMAQAEQASAKSAAKIEKDWSAVEKRIDGFGKSVRNVGLGMSAALTAPLSLIAKQSVTDFAEAARAVADVEAALKSTGNAAGKSSEELQKWANEAQFKSLYQDEEILKKVTANLLTFKNVTGDVFDSAQQAALDMSARLGQDLQSSTIQLGKALNDPVKGISALRRVGIQFSKSQEEMIKKLVESNDLLGAQKIILQEVQSQFAGAAEAQANAGGLGGLNEFNKNLGEIRETIGGLLVEIGAPLLEMLNGWLQAFRGLSPETQKFVVIAGGVVAVLGPILAVVGPIISAFAALAPVIAALASPIGIFVAAVAGISVALNAMGVTFEEQWNAVVALFNGVVAQLQLGAQLIVQLFQGDLTGALQTWGAMWQNLWTTLGNVINALFPGLIEAVTNFVTSISTSIQEGWSGLTEFVTTTWTNITTAITTAAANILTALQNLGTMALEAISSMVTAITDWMSNKLNAAWDTAIAGIHRVNDAFAWLRNEVTGNSHIPDMVDEIGAEMNRLDENMVKPAEQATSEVDSLFQSLGSTVSDSIKSWIKTGKFDIQGFISDISSKLIDFGVDSLFKGLFGSGGTQGGGLGSLFGGLFAEGGNPPMNKPSIVGENGPELFIPKVQGTVVSNKNSKKMLSQAANGNSKQSTRAGNVVQNINVYAKDVDSFRNSETSLGRRLKRQGEMGLRGT